MLLREDFTETRKVTWAQAEVNWEKENPIKMLTDAKVHSKKRFMFSRFKSDGKSTSLAILMALHLLDIQCYYCIGEPDSTVQRSDEIAQLLFFTLDPECKTTTSSMWTYIGRVV